MTTPRHLRHRLVLAWLLAAALLLAQSLGLAHQVLHAPGGAQDTALFGHHDGADCQLFDHLAHGDALAAALPPPLPDLPAAAPAAALQPGEARVCSTAYSARAPPRG